MINIIITRESVQHLEVDPNELLRYLGKQKHSIPLSAQIQKVISELTDYGKKVAQPQFTYRVLPVSKLAFHSRCLGDLLRRGDYAAIVVCTIGPKIEEMSTEFFAQKEYLKGVVLDAIGSTLAESFCENIARSLRDECRILGYRNSLRSSPGYGDWDITEQKKLFELIDADEIGVCLNGSCLMKPIKSVSFVSVIGRNLPEIYENHRKCDFCQKQDCKFRKDDDDNEFKRKNTGSD